LEGIAGSALREEEKGSIERRRQQRGRGRRSPSRLEKQFCKIIPLLKEGNKGEETRDIDCIRDQKRGKGGASCLSAIL